MSDPIEKLSRLGSALEGAPMPLPAEEIRRRGDRIRRRNHAVAAGVAAVAVAAVGLPVALTFGAADDEPEPAPSPTVVDPTRAPLGEANLITDRDAVYHQVAGWATRDTFEGDGQAAFNPCARSSLEDLGATTVFQREFGWVDEGLETFEGDPADYAPGNHLTEAVAEFGSPEDARSAYDEIAGWIADCSPSGTTEAEPNPPVAVDPGVDGEAETTVTYIEFEGGESVLETGLIVSGDRIAVLSQTIEGQDYIWGPEVGLESPVTRMIPPAAERLVGDEAGPGGAG